MTTRAVDATLLALMKGDPFRPVWFFEGQFESSGSPSLDYLRLWSGPFAFTWNGALWTGAGGLLAFGAINESSDLRAVGWSVSLSGSASLLALNVDYARQGLPGRVWLGAWDSSTGDLAAGSTPYKAFEGRFDVPEIVDEGGRVTITAKYESRFIDLDRARMRRYTDEDQQAYYPGDRGFEYVPSLQQKDLTWGRPQSITIGG